MLTDVDEDEPAGLLGLSGIPIYYLLSWWMWLSACDGSMFPSLLAVLTVARLKLTNRDKSAGACIRHDQNYQ